MIIGTAYFPSISAACRYYRDQDFDATAVACKLAQGEIFIGKPALKPGQTLTKIDNGTRYAIVEA